MNRYIELESYIQQYCFDFTFELEGNWIQKFFKGFFKKKYEDTACEMMAMHYAFYEELNRVGSVKEEEYVTREATICCSNGNGSIGCL